MDLLEIEIHKALYSCTIDKNNCVNSYSLINHWKFFFSASVSPIRRGASRTVSFISSLSALSHLAAFLSEGLHYLQKLAMAIEIDQQPPVGLSRVAVSETHGEDSPYFAGWKAYDENPYDESKNPSGVIQMGLAENQVGIKTINQEKERDI